MKAIHLQYVGLVAAIPAKDFQVGDYAVWNSGYLSEVVSVSPKGKTQLIWETRSEDGKLWTRVLKADRLVAIADRSLIGRYAVACNVDADSMSKHLHSDPMARKQFAQWKAAA